MKNIKIYFIILLMFGFLLSMGQAAQPVSQTKVKDDVQQLDPKLSPEEQALQLNAGIDNPTQIDESALVDPKIPENERAAEDDYGAANANPAPETLSDPKLTEKDQANREEPAPVEVYLQATTQQQAPGESIGTITDFRLLQGDGTQPEGEKPVKSDNYRDMQGPREQPEGDKPGK